MHTVTPRFGMHGHWVLTVSNGEAISSWMYEHIPAASLMCVLNTEVSKDVPPACPPDTKRTGAASILAAQPRMPSGAAALHLPSFSLVQQHFNCQASLLLVALLTTQVLQEVWLGCSHLQSTRQACLTSKGPCHGKRVRRNLQNKLKPLMLLLELMRACCMCGWPQGLDSIPGNRLQCHNR